VDHVAEERLGKHDLGVDVPVDPVDPLRRLHDLGHVVAAVRAADPGPNDEPVGVGDHIDDAGPPILGSQTGHDRDRPGGLGHRRHLLAVDDVVDVAAAGGVPEVLVAAACCVAPSAGPSGRCRVADPVGHLGVLCQTPRPQAGDQR
jgi:hypothetical protein